MNNIINPSDNSSNHGGSNYTGQRTSFPIFMLSFAIIFDFIKAILAITVVGMPVADVMTLMSDAIVIMWAFMMSGFKGIKDARIKKKVTKRAVIRLASSAILNIIPVAQIFPWTTWSVYGIWKDVNGK